MCINARQSWRQRKDEFFIRGRQSGGFFMLDVTSWEKRAEAEGFLFVLWLGKSVGSVAGEIILLFESSC